MTEKPVNREKILEIAGQSDVNRSFFELLSRRHRNAAVTTVEQAMEWTKGERREVVELFKQLDETAIGTFVIGRRGASSRFEWAVRLTDVGYAYAGEIEEIEPASQNDLEDEIVLNEQLVEHEYRLRPDLKVVLSLPSNLTKREAERLSSYIATLPYDDE